MLDLAVTNLAEQAESGYTFELINPATGEGTGGFIKVRGDKSKIVQAFARKRINELQKRERQNQGKNRSTELTIDEMEDMAVESAVVRVISWSGIGSGGQEIPFTKENATSIFKEHSWIREAVMEEAENLLNFRSE